MTDKRILGLQQASKQKQQEALNKTERAIESLVKNQQKITIRAVAREARVSVSYIYKYPELAYKIQSLRDAQKYDKNKPKKLTSIDNKNIAETNAKEQDLLQENARLKAYIDKIQGQKRSISQVQQENINLQLENEKLKQELEFTKQALAEARDFILSTASSDTQDKIESTTRKKVFKEIT